MSRPSAWVSSLAVVDVATLGKCGSTRKQPFGRSHRPPPAQAKRPPVEPRSGRSDEEVGDQVLFARVAVAVAREVGNALGAQDVVVDEEVAGAGARRAHEDGV